ncbi:hypothetical protein JCM5296_004610 [Sporobolomyces johnsonii]
MDLEPSTSTAPPVADEMTIDYEADAVNSSFSAGVDHEMGDDVGAEGEATVEEAEMADDEASGWEKERDQDTMIEEPVAESSSGIAEPVLPVASAPEPVISLPPASSPSVAPHTAAVERPATHPTAEIHPPYSHAEVTASASDPSAPQPPSSADELPTHAVGHAESLDSDVHTNEAPAPSTAAAAVHPLNGHAAPAIPQEASISEGEQADVEQSDAPELVSSLEGVEHVLAKLVPADHESPSTCSDASRPEVDKAALLGIEVPFPSTGDSSSPSAPAVFVSYDNTTYSLFRAHKLVDSEQDDDVPALLDGEELQHLYYGPLETLFTALHDQFPELQSREDELVLDFDEIGVALTEDNIYSRKVSLHDFDRIHIGCQLPGRLHARLYAQARFSSGFNALVQHIANSLAGGYVETVDGSEGTYEAVDEEEEADAFADETFVTVGEDDGPDSELPVLGGEGGEDGEGKSEEGAQGQGAPQVDEAQNGEEGEFGPEGEEGGEDDFDLEQALAQLDGDDVAAVVEGAEEDYLLSELPTEENQQEREQGVEHAAAESEQLEAGATQGVAAEGSEEGEVVGDAEGEVQGAAEEGAAEEGAAEEGAAEEGAADDSGVWTADVAVSAPEEVDAALDDAVADSADPTTTVPSDTSAPALVTAAPLDDPTIQPVDPAVSTTMAVPDLAQGAVADAGGEPVVENLDVSSSTAILESGLESTDRLAASNEIAEDALDSNDVVIDYDEAFDGSSSAAPEATVIPVTAPVDSAEEYKVSPPTPLSPKRSRASLTDEDDEEVAEDALVGSDAKRPRLADPVAVSSA